MEQVESSFVGQGTLSKRGGNRAMTTSVWQQWSRWDNGMREGCSDGYQGLITSLSSKPISMSLNDGNFLRLPIAATAALLSSI